MSLHGIVAIMLLVLLGACSYPDIGPTFTKDAKHMDAATFECCFEPEKFYPDPIARLGVALVSATGPKAANAAYGEYYEEGFPGLLTGKSDAVDAVNARLQPLDFLVVGSTSYQLARLVPGRFSHSAIYIGTEAELRAAGLWNIPELVPYHDEIRAGKTIIEAVSPAVQLSSTEQVLERDRALLVRPSLTASEKRLAIKRAFSKIGTPFNFTLGLDPNYETFSCTGFIRYTMPSLNMRERSVYGQRAILPDDVAAQAIRGENMRILGYILGNEGPGFTYRSTYALMVDIAAYWGVPGTPETTH